MRLKGGNRGPRVRVDRLPSALERRNGLHCFAEHVTSLFGISSGAITGEGDAQYADRRSGAGKMDQTQFRRNDHTLVYPQGAEFAKRPVWAVHRSRSRRLANWQVARTAPPPRDTTRGEGDVVVILLIKSPPSCAVVERHVGTRRSDSNPASPSSGDARTIREGLADRFPNAAPIDGDRHIRQGSFGFG